MAFSRLAEKEGNLLEAALRRIKLQQAESAWGLRWVEGEAEDEWPEAGPFGFVVDETGKEWRRAKSGGAGGLVEAGGVWKVVELREAAKVVNPVAKLLVAGLEEVGLEVEWVQQTLVRGLTKDAGKMAGLSVDVVVTRAAAGGRRDRWWVEVKWTRGDHEDLDLRVVKEGWKKVDVLQRVIQELEMWRLAIGGHPVYHPHRLGLLVVSPRGWRLEVRGEGVPVIRGTFENGGGQAAANVAAAESGGADEWLAEEEDVAMAAADIGGVDERLMEHDDMVMAGGVRGGGDDDGGDGGDAGEAESNDDGGTGWQRGGRRKVTRNHRYKQKGRGYDKDRAYRLQRMGGVGGGGVRTRSGGAAEFEGATKVGRTRAKQ